MNNKKIDCYVINLDRKKKDYERFQENWNKYFNIKRISSIDHKNCELKGIECCKKTHLDLMKKIILKNENDDNFIIIAEDDVYPTESFDNYWEKILNFIKNNKNNVNYDLIHLDILLNLDKKNNSISEYNDIFFTYSKGRNAAFMIYNKRFLKEFVNSEKFNEHYKKLDQALDFKEGFTFDNNLKKLTCKELIVRQYTDKISEITGDRGYIRHYDKWYDETSDILKQFSIL